MPFARIEQALERIARGEMVIVADDEDRENEGDLTMAAQFVSAESIAFMIRHARGLVCMPCDAGRLEELAIGPMASVNTCANETAFTVSIDHVSAGSGISAADRALTIRRVVDDASRPEDFNRPGHVFPLRTRPGGVIERRGHTEAAVDLARLAGLFPAAVICEALNPDGSVARLPELRILASDHGLAVVSIDAIAEYRRTHEPALTA